MFNLNGLVNNYVILDKNKNNITSKVTEIGTACFLLMGGETYTISIIGDLKQRWKNKCIWCINAFITMLEEKLTLINLV